MAYRLCTIGLISEEERDRVIDRNPDSQKEEEGMQGQPITRIKTWLEKMRTLREHSEPTGASHSFPVVGWGYRRS